TAPEERQGRDRPRARVRDVALARSQAGPLTGAGGRRDGALRLERLSTRPIASFIRGVCSGFRPFPPISVRRMEEFPEPGLLSDEELFELRDEVADELHWLCLRR